MAEIKLKCGSIVLLDDEDLKLVSMHTWAISGGYVSRKTTVDRQKGVTIGIHRVIMDAKRGEIIDHENGNILDNRRENLRVATILQNGMNMRKKPFRSSQFKGVTWNRSSKKWQAQINSILQNPHSRYLGVFACEHEAGHAYNKAAVELFGDFACLNPVGFP